MALQSRTRRAMSTASLGAAAVGSGDKMVSSWQVAGISSSQQFPA